MNKKRKENKRKEKKRKSQQKSRTEKKRNEKKRKNYIILQRKHIASVTRTWTCLKVIDFEYIDEFVNREGEGIISRKKSKSRTPNREESGSPKATAQKKKDKRKSQRKVSSGSIAVVENILTSYCQFI